MHEIIQIDGSTVLFLKTGTETQGQFSLCECTVPPHAGFLVPHLHTDFDQMIVGMDGMSLWSVGNQSVNVGAGERLFIPRGVSHSFANRQAFPTRFACIFTPALIGPEFFREFAAATHLPAALREVELSLILHRFRMIPVADA